MLEVITIDALKLKVTQSSEVFPQTPQTQTTAAARRRLAGLSAAAAVGMTSASDCSCPGSETVTVPTLPTTVLQCPQQNTPDTALVMKSN